MIEVADVSRVEECPKEVVPSPLKLLKALICKMSPSAGMQPHLSMIVLRALIYELR